MILDAKNLYCLYNVFSNFMKFISFKKVPGNLSAEDYYVSQFPRIRIGVDLIFKNFSPLFKAMEFFFCNVFG